MFTHRILNFLRFREPSTQPDLGDLLAIRQGDLLSERHVDRFCVSECYEMKVAVRKTDEREWGHVGGSSALFIEDVPSTGGYPLPLSSSDRADRW